MADKLTMTTKETLIALREKVEKEKRRSDSSTYLYEQGQSHAYEIVSSLITETIKNLEE